MCDHFKKNIIKYKKMRTKIKWFSYKDMNTRKRLRIVLGEAMWESWLA